jgi:exodeoxyribonuclease VII large subunit
MTADRAVLTVSQLSQQLAAVMEEKFPAVWVEGEISNFKVYGSGHAYFTLKDEGSQLRCVLFRTRVRRVRFEPRDGLHVLAFGAVEIYPQRGEYSLVVELLEPKGVGALQLAFEQLKQRLHAEGLFDPARKRALPRFPRKIGIVTSPSGAALRDMLRVIGDRYPDRRIIVLPVKVQGDGAAQEIAAGITDLGQSGLVDVMIVGRGGGSLEDLWAFNEEIVARAIFASPVPVISAVGHEIDFTVADFVADCRAPTPTAAAEIAVPKKIELIEQLSGLEEQLLRCVRRKLEMAKESWRGLVKRMADPERKMHETQQRLDDLSGDLVRSFRDCLRQFKDELGYEGGRLDALSPLAVLQRGYSIAHKLPEEKIIKNADSLIVGDLLRVTFAEGKSICRVERKA